MARELVSTKPLKELAEMKSDMERLMDAFLYGEPKITRNGEQQSLPVDVTETKENLVVRAEIPGLNPEDFQISLSRNVLTIKGEKREEGEQKGESFHIQERIEGPFVRLVDLPKPVQSDKIRALYRDGVLTITLPKAVESEKKKIKVKIK